jgi:thioredoxin-related protein
MRRAAIVVAVLFAALAVATVGQSSLEKLNTPRPLEIVVFERAGCTYCQIFRRDVLPQYNRSPTAAKAPMRFVDIDQVDLDALPLQSHLTILPTAVIMHNGRELERIAGYTGPEIFFQIINHLLAETL